MSSLDQNGRRAPREDFLRGLACVVKSFHRQASKPGGLGQVGSHDSRPTQKREKIGRSTLEESATRRGAQDRVEDNGSSPGLQPSDDRGRNAGALHHANLHRGPAERAGDQGLGEACSYRIRGARLDTFDASFVLPCPSGPDENGPRAQGLGCEEISHQACAAGWVQSPNRHHKGLPGRFSCAGTLVK